MFSIYLTNDEKSNGKITFGGYDMSYAQKGKEVSWIDTSANLAYWTVNAKEVMLGEDKIFDGHQ